MGQRELRGEMKQDIILKEEFIEECKAIITEAVFTSRWSLVEGHWTLGKLIREEAEKLPITEYCNAVAVELDLSSRTIWYAVQCFDKYPSLDKIPEGKNISWRKLILKYLTDSKDKEPKLEKTIKCPGCGLVFPIKKKDNL